MKSPGVLVTAVEPPYVSLGFSLSLGVLPAIGQVVYSLSIAQTFKHPVKEPRVEVVSEFSLGF